jgi:small subunit ribosomal protein S8
MYSDPIADMLTRIRNANAARHANVEIPASKLKLELAKILHAEGFIRGFQLVGKGRTLRLRLRYTADREPILHGLKRVSKPGQRIYAGKEEVPRVLAGLGIAIVSTSRGVMTGQTARKAGLGGEVLAFVW